MRFYKAYGLILKSEFEIHELVEEDVDQDTQIDVTIMMGSLPDERLEALHWLDTRIGVGKQTLWFDITGLAKYAVIDGQTIMVDPYPNADSRDLTVFLLGSSLGALLWQRNFLVLHGNGIRIENRVLVCVGRSGAGKSTLAAEFIRRGFPVVADDVVAINNANRVFLGIPRIKLWQDAADHLEVRTEGLARVQANMEKFSVPMKVDRAIEDCLARWVVELTPTDCKEPEIEVLGPMAALPLLIENSYRAELIAGMGLQAQHFLQCATLANHAIIARVKRPTEDFQLEELANLLVAFTKANP